MHEYRVTVELCEPRYALDGETIMAGGAPIGQESFKVQMNGAFEALWAAHDRYKGQPVFVVLLLLQLVR